MIPTTEKNETLTVAPRYREIAETLAPEQTLVLNNASWEDYEEISEDFDDARGFRLIYNNGKLEIMTVSVRHEYYSEFLKQLIGILSLRLRQKVLFFGSATMKKRGLLKGCEPDAEFFVSRSELVSGNIKFDIGTIPPDIVVEIDVFHTSEEKFEIYAAFGVPEFWLYDEKMLTINRLESNNYKKIEASVELPYLTAELLTDFLNRSQTEDQFELLMEFENWLHKNK